jgi:hypothetical protein
MEARPGATFPVSYDESPTLNGTSPVGEVCEAIRQATRSGSAVTLQCTLAAAAQVVNKAIECETQAAAAALSLAQRQTLEALRADLCTAADALDAALDRQGRCLLPSRSSTGLWSRLLPWTNRSTSTPSWWSALDTTLDTLDGAAEELIQLGEAQPGDAPARTIAEATAHLLREQHRRLSRHVTLQPV